MATTTTLAATTTTPAPPGINYTSVDFLVGVVVGGTAGLVLLVWIIWAGVYVCCGWNNCCGCKSETTAVSDEAVPDAVASAGRKMNAAATPAPKVIQVHSGAKIDNPLQSGPARGFSDAH